MVFKLFKASFHKPITIDDSLDNIYLNSRPDFWETYHKAIYPKVQAFDSKRLEALKKYKKRAPIALCIGLGLAACLILIMLCVEFDNPQGSRGLGELAGAIFLGAYFWATKPERDYNKLVKESIFPHAFDFLGLKSYKIAPPYSPRDLYHFDIIPKNKLFHAEDYVAGEYKGVIIELFEFYYSEHGLGNYPAFIDTYKKLCRKQCLVIKLKMNKPFKGKTILVKKPKLLQNKDLSDRMPSTTRQWCTNAMENKASTEEVFTDGDKEFVSASFTNKAVIKSPNTEEIKLQKITLENTDISNKYLTLSTDQVEARYLLSLTFMERLHNLGKLFGVELLECSFHEKELLILVHTSKDRMEPKSIFEPTTFEKDCEKLIQEMEEIFQIVDVLKLYEKTHL